MLAGEALAAFQLLPLAGLTDVLGDATPLVLAPHPDDESLGCGGFIAACCAEGRPPLVVIATDGTGSHPASRCYPPARLRALREAEAREAVARLGLPPERLTFLGLPDTAAPRDGPAFERAVETLAGLAAAFRCGAVVAPWLQDPHCDHEATQRMARELARRVGLKLRSYPVWGWTLQSDMPLAEPPVRGWRLDITAHRSAKRHAIAAHVSQMSNLISDDPTGFRVPPELLAVLDRPYEVLLSSA